MLALFCCADAQPEIIQGQWGFLELGHTNKHIVKNTWKKGYTGKNFGVFSPRYCQNRISNENFILKMDTIRAFFPKLGHFFQFLKKARGGLLTSLAIVACLPCFDEVKVSTVNSDLINFVNFQS